ncbi:MAG: DUF481 domain-containing protein [Planctomycetota bacterium]
MPNRFSLYATPAALLACLMATPTQAGKVTLTNDDTITGTVTSQTDEGVTVEHPELGTLNLEAAQVAGVTLDENDPIYVAPPVPEFFFGWEKTLTAGVTGTTGNTDTVSSYGSFKTGYEDDSDRWDFKADVVYALSEGETTANNFTVDLNKDWLLPDRKEFYWANARFEYNDFADFQDRTSLFGGIGYPIIEEDNHTLNGRIGGGGSYNGGTLNEFTPELFIELEGEWIIDDRSSIVYSTTFLPTLDPFFEEFRNITEAAYKIQIDTQKGLSLEIGVRNFFDSEVDEGFEENDLTYYAALALDF